MATDFSFELSALCRPGQFFPRQKRISFTILDAGLTIPAMVRNAFASSQNKEDLANVADYRLIQWATEQGNTTKNVKDFLTRKELSSKIH